MIIRRRIYAVDVLGSNAATPREHIEGDTLAQEDVPSFTAHRSDVLDRLERLAFLHVPFYPAAIMYVVSMYARLMSQG